MQIVKHTVLSTKCSHATTQKILKHVIKIYSRRSLFHKIVTLTSLLSAKFGISTNIGSECLFANKPSVFGETKFCVNIAN